MGPKPDHPPTQDIICGERLIGCWVPKRRGTIHREVRGRFCELKVATEVIDEVALAPSEVSVMRGMHYRR